MAGSLRGFSGRWMLLVWSAGATALWAAPGSMSPANATLASSSPVTRNAQTASLNVSKVVSVSSQMTTTAAWLSGSVRVPSAAAAEAIVAVGRNATVAYTISAAATHTASNPSARNVTEAVATRSASAANASAATIEPSTTTQLLRNFSATTVRHPTGDAATSAGSTTATQRPNQPLVTVGNVSSSFVTGKNTEATAGGSSNSSGGSIRGSSSASTVRSMSTSVHWTTLLNNTNGVSPLATTTRSQTEGQRVTSGPMLTPPFLWLNSTAFVSASQATTVVLGGASTVNGVLTLRTTAAAVAVSGGRGSGGVTAAQVYSPNDTAAALRNSSSLTSSTFQTFRSSPAASGAVTHSDGGQSSTGWTPYTTRKTEEASLLTSLRVVPSVTGATSTNSQLLVTSAGTARPLNATAGVTTSKLFSSSRSMPSAQTSGGASVESSRSVIDGAKVTAANATWPLPAWELTTSVGSSGSRGQANGTAATQPPPSSPQASATREWTSTAPATRASDNAAIIPVNRSGISLSVVSTMQSLTLTAVGGTSQKNFAENATSMTSAASGLSPTRTFSASAVPKSSLPSTVATPSVSSAASAASRSSEGPSATTTLASFPTTAATVTSRPPNVSSKSDPPASASVHVQTFIRASTTAPRQEERTIANASLDAVATTTHSHAVSSPLRVTAMTAMAMALRPSNTSAAAAVNSAATAAPQSRSSSGDSGSTANSLRKNSVNATSVSVRNSTPPPTAVTTAVLVNRQSTVHTASINSSFPSTPTATASLPSYQYSTTKAPPNTTASTTWITTTALPSRSNGGGSAASSLRPAGVSTTSVGARISTLPPTVAATAAPMTSRQSIVHSAPPNSSFGSTRQAASNAAAAAAATSSPPIRQNLTTPAQPNATASTTRVATHSPPQPTTLVNRSASIVTLTLPSATVSAASVTTRRLPPSTAAMVSGVTSLPPASVVVAATTTHVVAGASVNDTLRRATALAISTAIFQKTTIRADGVNSTVGRLTEDGSSSSPPLRTSTATASLISHHRCRQ